MKKAFWLILLGLLLACGPSTADSQPTTSDPGEETAVATDEPTADTEQTAAAENMADEADEGEIELPAATNLDSFVPATTVEEAAVIREQDWLRGAADPIVVIIEYGDFQ